MGGELDKARRAASQDRDPDAYVVRLRDLRVALAEVDRLTAALAEAEATLANERGEGEPPSEGWEPCDTSPGRWEHRSRQWCCYRIKSKDYIVIVRGSLSGEIAREKTARAAMRAAAGVKS